MRHTFSILAVLASTAFAGEIQARDACSDACANAYNTCRSQPDANRASCAANYATCLGYNPFDNSGSLVTPTGCVITTATPAPPAPTSACVTACNNAYDTCRSQPDANRAGCAADYAGCLGYNPFESGSLVAPTACVGSPIVTTAASNGTRSMTMTTQVVMSYTTYCPSPTSLVVNSKTYTVTQPTTLTITNCPCTITTSVPVSTPAVVVPPAATTKPVQVAGAGNMKPAMALLAGVGAVALL
ncbi:hypothetical protein N8I77_007308 [Diaporthe amygdali]|uniref:Uncharacterized protein n=1 Tax=Phomopsis amygdali TaxID=1214568 RepID=A0AAD9SBS3_PHOAM|nr:hypothetical protein N8I77_007308 [Diaporthe amygdali]